MVLNKWDLLQEPQGYLEHERARIAAKLRLRPRLLTASAKTGRNLSLLLGEALALGERMKRRIPTAELNRFLAEATSARQPPLSAGGGRPRRLKLLYMTQVAERPPRFAIQVASRRHLKRDYTYFLENRLRERYGMDGVPLIIDFVERGQRAIPAQPGAPGATHRKRPDRARSHSRARRRRDAA
jgi:GTP-binding protein